MAKALHQAYQVAPKQEQTLVYQCYQAFLYNWSNRYRLLDKIKRHGIIAEEQLTEKTTYLGEKAKKLLRVILKMIFRGGKAVVKQKYLYSITKCCAKQNRRLFNELLDFIQFKKIQVWERRKISHYYSITLSASLQEKIKAVELENENSNGTKMSRSIYNRKSSKEDLDLSRTREELNPNSNVSNSNNPTCCNKELQSDTTESADTEQMGGKEKSLSVVPSPSSKRLSEGKTFKKHKIRNQKTLSDMVPILTDRICQEIIAKSGRLDFDSNYIKQLIMKLDKVSKHVHFFSLKGFISYMSNRVREELRDPIKCSSPNYRMEFNLDQELREDCEKNNISDFVTYKDRENYLNNIEDSAIYCRNDNTQYRAKIVGVFPPNLAYSFLTNIKTFRKVGEVFEILMVKKIEISEHYQSVLLNQANAVGEYTGVNKLEFINGD